MTTRRATPKRNATAGGVAPREHATLWRDAALDNLELLRAQFVTQTFAPHTHDTYAIGMVESGLEAFDYRGRRELAGPGAIGIIHPGELHTGGPAGDAGWRYCALYPDAVLMQRALAGLSPRRQALPFFRDALINDPELFAELIAVHSCCAEGDAALERESGLIWVLAKLIARYAEHDGSATPLRTERAVVAQVVAYLHDNLSLNIRLADLSALTHMSEFHLLRVFRAETGLPPHAYLNQLRLTRAKALLAAGSAPADVAQRVGFADQAHLTRRFKRVYGVTPGAAR